MLGPYVQSAPMAGALKLSPTHGMDSQMSYGQNGYFTGQHPSPYAAMFRRDVSSFHVDAAAAHHAAATGSHTMFSTGLHSAGPDPFTSLHDPMQAGRLAQMRIVQDRRSRRGSFLSHERLAQVSKVAVCNHRLHPPAVSTQLLGW